MSSSLINKNNLYIFSLAESGFPIHYLKTVFNLAGEKIINEDFIKNLEMRDRIKNSIIKKIKNLNLDYISVYSLCLLDVSEATIHKIFEVSADLRYINRNLPEIADMLKLQSRICNKIELLSNIANADLNNNSNGIKILNILKSSPNPKTVSEIFIEFSRQFGIIDLQEIFDILQKLHAKKKVSQNNFGYEYRRPTLKEALCKLPKSKRDILERRIGISTKNVGAENNESNFYHLYRIIETMPLLENEDSLRYLYEKYNISKTLAKAYFSNEKDYHLYRYVKCKYKSESKDNLDIQFLEKYCDPAREEHKKLLRELNYGYIDNKIVKLKFIDIFTKYVNDNNLFDITEKTFLQFKKYINDQNSDLKNGWNTDELKRKLENSDLYIKTNKNFLYIGKIELKEEIVKIFKDYLNSIEFISSTQLLIEKHKDALKKLNISNKFDVHAILKRYYSNDYPDLSFSRNPHIQKKNYDFSEFIGSLLKKTGVVKTSDFLTFAEKETGIQRNTFHSFFSKIISEYNIDGFLYPCDLQLPERSFEFIEHMKIFPLFSETNLLKKMCSFGIEKGKLFLFKRLLKSHEGYVYDNGLFFKNTFRSGELAFVNLLESLPKIFEKSVLYQYIDDNCLNRKYKFLLEKEYVLSLDNNYYINILTLFPDGSFEIFKQQLVGSIRENSYFTKYSLMKDNHAFRNIIDEYPLINDSLNVVFFSEMMRCLDNIYQVKVCKKLFSKNREITKQQVIEGFLLERDYIPLDEINDQINLVYGLENFISAKDSFSDMGFYFSIVTGVIYRSKEVFRKMLENVL